MERTWRSGPRLPDRPGPSDDIDRDPAEGAAVPRCLTCGLPRSMTGRFIPDGGPFAGRVLRYRLCLRCLEYANGPLVPSPTVTDPLDATAA